MLAPDHPEGDEGGLGYVGGVAHKSVHPQAMSVLAQLRSMNPQTSAGGPPLVFNHRILQILL